MTSKELNLKLITSLPEIKNLYIDEVEWQEGDDTGSHVVFGDVLTPFLLDSLNNINIIKKIFDFLEAILQENDEYATEVITFSVLESIIMEDIDCLFIESMLGDKLKEIWEDLKE